MTNPQETASLKLYGNKYSGHTYKVRLYLALTGIDYSYETIDLMTPNHQRAQSFQEVSRYGEVPTLLIDGIPYVQSNAILLKLAEMTGLLSGDQNADLAREWMFWEANRIGMSLPNLRFMRLFNTDTPKEVLDWLRARMIKDLGFLDHHLGSGSGFIVGDKISIADCSCIGYMYWLHQTGETIEDWPHLKAWLGRISALTGWQHPDKMPDPVTGI